MYNGQEDKRTEGLVSIINKLLLLLVVLVLTVKPFIFLKGSRKYGINEPNKAGIGLELY